MKTRPRILLYVLGLVFFISPWVIVFLFVSRVGSLAAGVGAIIGGFFTCYFTRSATPKQ